MREWLARLTGPGLFVFYSVTLGIVAWLFGMLVGLNWSPLSAVLFGLLMGGYMTFMILRGRARLDASVARISHEVMAAIRTGELPGLINAEAWLTALAVRRAGLQRGRASTVVALVVFVGVPLLLSIGSTHWYGWLVFVALVAGAIIWRLVSDARQLPRVIALQEKIEAIYGVGNRDQPT